MNITFSVLTKEMKLNPGISEDRLEQIITSLPYPLPDDFIAFLKFSNGGRGMVGKHYLLIEKAEELLKFNNDYHVPIDAPGLFIFGTNGGGEAYGFDLRNQDYTVVMIPFIGMEWDQAIMKGKTFSDFLEHLFNE